MGEADFEWSALRGLTSGQLAALKQGLVTQYKKRIQSMDELCRRLFDETGETHQHVSQPERNPQPEPKPQLKREEPSVSETGTVALIREETEVPAIHTAPVVQAPAYTAPVEKMPAVHIELEEDHPVTAAETALASQQQSFASGIKTLVLIVIAAILVLMLVVFMPQSGTKSQAPIADGDPTISTLQEETRPKETEPIESEPAPTEAVGTRMLRNPEIIYKGKNISWEEYDYEANYAFGTEVLRKNVASITFLGSLRDAPKDAVDVSQNKDGSVLAWTVKNGKLFDLYIAAEGKIYAPSNCTAMFARYTNLKEIRFNGVFDTSNTTNMWDMFYDCRNLSKLDFLSFDTQKVISMRAMFHDCRKLTSLDLSGFDTRNVTDMGWMFAECRGLKELNISGFDTGNVVDMGVMFYNCSGLTQLDISGFNTRNALFTCWMFYGCSRLEELDISGFDTSNVIEMQNMFCRTGKIKNVTANFVVKQVKNYESFMDPGDTFNGRPWKELFQ